MRKIICLALLTMVCSSQAVFAQSQTELNQQAGQGSAKSDKELNAVWRNVLAKYATNTEFITKLRKAESAWIVYRDKHLDAVWPNADPSYYGSAFDMCRSSELGGLTKARTKDLKLLLNHAAPLPASAAMVATGNAAVDSQFKKGLKAATPEEPLFTKKYQQAQTAWTAFRDADSDAWQALDASTKDSSAAKYSRIVQLDKARVKELDGWVRGIPEGDVCTGSRITY
ncbi:MAG: DUF1311 domain-containing protein [Cyanobacteria bacterium REEB67]|nr:DUF1311 domain-containing protein [Cyanobacteria bacterium REEB67]